MKKRIKRILILVCIAMSFVGVAFWFVLKDENNLRDNYVINLNGDNVQEKLPVININEIYPGCEKTCSITLKGSLSEKYDVALDFHEDKSKNNDLVDYLNVRIETKEKNIEKKLKELLNGEKVELGNNASKITITYYMPTSIGNESQDTSAAFYIELIAKSIKK